MENPSAFLDRPNLCMVAPAATGCLTVLAYQCVQVIRKTLKGLGIHDSWATLRKTMSVQQRLTASMQRADGRIVHIRKSTKAEPTLMRIYQALGISAAPRCTKKLVA